MRKWILKCVVIGSTLLAQAAAVAGPAIVVLGDSLSSGYGLNGAPSWVKLLERRLVDQGYDYDVVDAAISGDTTAGGLSRLPRLLDLHSPAIVVIELGGNDGLRGQPIANMRQNLARIIELVREHGAKAILTGIQIPPNYGPIYTEQFAAVYRELAAEFDIALVEFLMDGVALEDHMMQADRMHPNAEGQPIMLDNVWPVLQGLLR
jgi:acyl-CoA thioesterase-1